MLATELKELLSLRRKAKDKEEKELIDRAIDKLINGINTTIFTIPSFPQEADDPSKWDLPYLQRYVPKCESRDGDAQHYGANDLVNRQPNIKPLAHTSVPGYKSATEADDNISIIIHG